MRADPLARGSKEPRSMAGKKATTKRMVKIGVHPKQVGARKRTCARSKSAGSNVRRK